MKRKILAAAKRSVAASEQQEPERLRTGKRKAVPLKAGDFLLTALVMVLVVFGVIMVFSASYYYAISEEGTPYSSSSESSAAGFRHHSHSASSDLYSSGHYTQ